MFAFHRFLPPSVGSFLEVEEIPFLVKVKLPRHLEGVRVPSLYMKAVDFVKLPGGKHVSFPPLTPSTAASYVNKACIDVKGRGHMA